MQERLATLPWVEADTITTDRKTRQAKFTLKSGAKFDLGDVKRVLTPRYADGVTVLTPPTGK